MWAEGGVLSAVLAEEKAGAGAGRHNNNTTTQSQGQGKEADSCKY